MSDLTKDERVEHECDCYDDDPSLWGPACFHFEDNDKGRCMGCGHVEECHERH